MFKLLFDEILEYSELNDEVVKHYLKWLMHKFYLKQTNVQKNAFIDYYNKIVSRIDMYDQEYQFTLLMGFSKFYNSQMKNYREFIVPID